MGKRIKSVDAPPSADRRRRIFSRRRVSVGVLSLVVVALALIILRGRDRSTDDLSGRASDGPTSVVPLGPTSARSLLPKIGEACRISGTVEGGKAARVRIHSALAELDLDADILLEGRAFFAELPEQGRVVVTAVALDGRTKEATAYCDGSGALEVRLRFDPLDPAAGYVVGRCVYLETGAVVEDATVRASLSPQSPRTEREPLRVLWSSLTDARGDFRAAVTPGSYEVRCRKDMDEGVPVEVVVVRGETVRLDLFVEARAAIVGSVEDETGKLVPGAEVVGRPARAGAANTIDEIASSRTDADGRFILRGFPLGPVAVEAHKSGAFAEAHVIARAELPYAEVRLVLGPAGSGIAGFVYSVEGVPIEGARVFGEAIGPRRGRPPRVPQARASTTNDEGRFELLGLSPGRYLVRASSDGLAEARVEVTVADGIVEVSLLLAKACVAEFILEPRMPRRPAIVSIRPVGVGDPTDPHGATPTGREIGGQTGDVLELENAAGRALVTARTLGSVSNTATATVDLCADSPIRLILGTSASDDSKDERKGTVVVTVVDQARKPVAGATVRLPPPDYTATTDAEGRARIADVVPGRYWATVEGGNDAKALDVVGGRTHEVELRLDRHEGMIRGKVTAMGTPVEGAKILALCLSSGAMPDLMNAGVVARTDDGGGFEFEPKGGGVCTVRAEHPTKGRSEPVTLRAGGLPAWIELQPGATIEGHVRVRDTRQPAVPAALRFVTRGRAAGLEARTVYVNDPSGAFHLDGVLPGTVSITATTKEGNGHVDIEVSPGERRSGVEVTVFSIGAVRGRVVARGAVPAPIAGARVSLVGFSEQAFDASKFGRVTSGPDGSFLIQVPAGSSLRLYASAAGYYPKGSDPFDLDPFQGTTDVGDIALDRRAGPEEKEGGIGVVIAEDPRGARVIQFTPISPAAEAGLQVGDVIVSVDNVPVSRQPIINWVVSLRGPVGTPVVLGVERGADRPFTVVVVRRAVGLKEVPQAVE